ncbi:MAG: hypothetical protein M1839_007215 [Geoglossum umbratile]|nr:MAG: hypothetical protein M1839_007215 [Geoglossum umbratile]
MATRLGKQTLHERRKGESALSEFADYVEKQQKFRQVPGSSTATAGSKSDSAEDHAELDIIDSLGLADSVTHVRLKELLLAIADPEERLSQLTDILRNRIEEGNGETLFELGYENNGESMALTKDEWGIAMERLQAAAAALHAECRILITRNVGGEYEAETVSEKDKHADGKIMIRRKPDTVEDVIELRIAVVGNGML